MTRRRAWLARALPSVLCLVWGCSRPSSGDGPSPPPSASAPAAPLASPLPGSAATAAAPTSPSKDLVLTPEDAEVDAAHRITDQNLESELDRLEREIQAE